MNIVIEYLNSLVPKDLDGPRKSKLYLVKEAVIEYIDRLMQRDLDTTGESKVYLAKEALTILVQNKQVEGILG